MKKTEETQTKNPKAALHLIAIILIAVTMVTSAVGLFGWSKYIAAQSSNATAAIAKWYFNLKTGEYTQNGPQLLSLTRTDNKEHVEEGKLAPGTSGILPIIVDTTGTETDLTYDVTITINNCPRNIVFTPQTPDATIQEITEEAPYVRTIKIGKYVPYAEVGEHDETIAWNWPYETTTGAGVTANDIIDTEDNGQDVTVTITAVGTEVLSRTITKSTITDGTNTINNGDTVTLRIGEGTKTITYSTKTEPVTYEMEDTSIATITDNGVITPVAPGQTDLTITGVDSGEQVKLNVEVKKQSLNVYVGDTVYYTPTGTTNGVNTYIWKNVLASSTNTAEITLKSGANQSFNIPEWYVFSVDGDNIQIVPKKPSPNVALAAAQGYNNGVKLLNDACSALYSDESKNITARSIKLEDFEWAMSTSGGNIGKLNTAKTNIKYGTQRYSTITADKGYPRIYPLENKSVIDTVLNENGLGLSEQNAFIEKTDSTDKGLDVATSSLRPYQTYFTLPASDLSAALGTLYKRVLLNNNTYSPKYWIASRCIESTSNKICNFRINMIYNGGLDAKQLVTNQTTSSGNSESCGLFPVVQLTKDDLETTATARVYNVK
ncbi:MAG: hypothetical protein IKQ33_05160 [Clostridia bacterium]|nr:hypothetical protein [Clostridia bacterium]